MSSSKKLSESSDRFNFDIEFVSKVFISDEQTDFMHFISAKVIDWNLLKYERVKSYVIFGYTGGWNPRIDMYISSKGISILVHSVGATNLSW